MSNDLPAELATFLRAHPGIRFFDAFVNDLDTVERGQRIDRAGISRVYEAGVLLPGSVFALGIPGGTSEPTGLGFDDGDAERPCRPIPGTLVTVPWLDADGVAQLQLTMYEADGRPCLADPRNVLARVLDRFHRLNLTPVIAIEYEFGLVHVERGEDGLPRPPADPPTCRGELRKQIDSTPDCAEYPGVLAEIDAACRIQGVPATPVRAGPGPARYEVALGHRPDALAACDQAMRFKRIVEQVARRHGCEATFITRPCRDLAGAGLRVHASLLDAGGGNIFAGESPTGSADLRHAVRGLLDTLADGMAICAPGPDSYRRIGPEAAVPITASWSVDDRGSALRIPVGDPAKRRIEHRLAGADANPYLVVAWMLAGIHRGLSRGEEPPPPLGGDGGRPAAAGSLPVHWPQALERFVASGFAAEYLGAPFTRLYGTVKRPEMEQSHSHVPPLETERSRGPL